MKQTRAQQLDAAVRTTEQALIATLPADPADIPTSTREVFDGLQNDTAALLQAKASELLTHLSALMDACTKPDASLTAQRQRATRMACFMGLMVAMDDVQPLIGELSERAPRTTSDTHQAISEEVLPGVEETLRLAELGILALAKNQGVDLNKPVASIAWPPALLGKEFAQRCDALLTAFNREISAKSRTTPTTKRTTP